MTSTIYRLTLAHRTYFHTLLTKTIVLKVIIMRVRARTTKFIIQAIRIRLTELLGIRIVHMSPPKPWLIAIRVRITK